MKHRLYSKPTFLLILTLLFAFGASSQKYTKPYKASLGLKYRPASLTYKVYNAQGDAMEILLSKYESGTRLSAMFELCPALNTSGSLRAVLGPGVHVAIWDKDQKLNTYNKNPIVGVGGIIGMEFKIPNAPIALQADFYPSIDLIGNSDTYTNWGGLSIRYAW